MSDSKKVLIEMDHGEVDDVRIEMWDKLWPVVAAAIGATNDATGEEGPLFTEITTEKHGAKLNGALLAVAQLCGVLEQVALQLGAPRHVVVETVSVGRNAGHKWYDNARIIEEEQH